MTEEKYNKKKYGYDKEFNNSKEYMQEFKPVTFEHRPSLLDNLVDFFEAPHTLSRGKVIFVASTILYLATPAIAKFVIQSGVPAFLHYYGAAILALGALFVLTRSDKH
jgi:hypothetical protein